MILADRLRVICAHIPIIIAPASAPTYLMAMATSATSITVMWEEVPVVYQNGVITVYEVLYVPLETFDGAIGSLSVNVTERMTNLTDLQEYVNYTISVRAYTSVGVGPYHSCQVSLFHSETQDFRHCLTPNFDNHTPKLGQGSLIFNHIYYS